MFRLDLGRSKGLALAVLLFGLAIVEARADEPAADSNESAAVSYYRDVRPIFQKNCQGCHQPAKPMGELVLTSMAGLLKGGESETPAVVPGKPDESELLAQITAPEGETPAMPKERDPLAAADVEIIRRWISAGAVDDTPEASRETIDMDHPPAYSMLPVITALDYSPDGQLLAVSGYHEVVLHKADGSAIVSRLVGLSERIESVAFSPDGSLLAVSGGSPGRFGEVQIWDVAATELKLSLPVTYDTVYGVSWSHDGTRVAFGCGDNTLRAIDAASGQQVLYQGAHSDWVLDTVFSNDSTHLISVSRDRSMKLTEVATERFVDNITSITPGALKGGLMTVDVQPGKDQVVIGGADGVPKVYQIYRTKDRKIGDDFNLIRAFDGLPGRIFDVGFNADGSRFAAGSSKDGTGEVRVYQTDDGKLVSKLEGEMGAIYAVAFRGDGQQVASGGFDGVVRLHDANTGKLIHQFDPVPMQDSQVAAASEE